MARIITIGVYGFSEPAFFDALRQAEVDVFCDIRWRRGVRGAQYAFANHKRLQARLEALGIIYLHRRDLAPTPDIRHRQAAADKAQKTARRKRQSLSPEFIAAYQEEILTGFDPRAFLESLPKGSEVVALFCVEGQPAACHRSLVAEKLCQYTGMDIEHLLPE